MMVVVSRLVLTVQKSKSGRETLREIKGIVYVRKD